MIAIKNITAAFSDNVKFCFDQSKNLFNSSNKTIESSPILNGLFIIISLVFMIKALYTENSKESASKKTTKYYKNDDSGQQVVDHVVEESVDYQQPHFTEHLSKAACCLVGCAAITYYVA